jgi:pseudouridine-5'-phosphate glycosidase
MSLKNLLRISSKVQEALSGGRPVIALESTIISHGMPFPQNLSTALELEKLAESLGAVPATVACVDGAIRVGLSEPELQTLARAGPGARKVSRRDLGWCLARRELGATTVSATMLAAALAGVRVFATGGVGGVHRGVQDTMDVSADLTELGRTPVMVVSAGVKSVLDIPRTLEYLETQGVPVVALRSRLFPAFFSTAADVVSPFDCRSEREVARVAAAHWALPGAGGLLVAVPNPRPIAEMESLI